jgi:hypothetical protein
MAGVTMKESSPMSRESLETQEEIMQDRIVDPLGDLPDAYIQKELDENPDLLARVLAQIGE